MTKHKHCPFCGYNNTAAEVESGEGSSIGKVSCNVCGATVWGMGTLVDPRGEVTPESLIESAYRFWDARNEARE